MQRLALALSLSAILVIVSLAIGSPLPDEVQSSTVESIGESMGDQPNTDAVGADATGSEVASADGITAFAGQSRRRPPTTVDRPRTTVPASTTPPTSTRTDRPKNSTTTTSPRPNTGPPPTTPVVGSGNCILDQIAREPFKGATGDPKTKFNIIINDLDAGINLWTAPYKVDLGNGWGWISGDRAGYKGGYMFLVNRGTGQVVARVLFHQVDGAAYLQVNDSFMDEIHTTGIGYDGTCADGSSSDPNAQAQVPEIKESYNIDDTTEVRPKIPMLVNGTLVEDRSYTNTVTPGIDIFRFTDLGKITTPFTDYNGVGGTPHTVYQRQRVGGLVARGDGFNLAVVVYYDWLVPYGTFG